MHYYPVPVVIPYSLNYILWIWCPYPGPVNNHLLEPHFSGVGGLYRPMYPYPNSYPYPGIGSHHHHPVFVPSSVNAISHTDDSKDKQMVSYVNVSVCRVKESWSPHSCVSCFCVNGFFSQCRLNTKCAIPDSNSNSNNNTSPNVDLTNSTSSSTANETEMSTNTNTTTVMENHPNPPRENGTENSIPEKIQALDPRPNELPFSPSISKSTSTSTSNSMSTRSVSGSPGSTEPKWSTLELEREIIGKDNKNIIIKPASISQEDGEKSRRVGESGNLNQNRIGTLSHSRLPPPQHSHSNSHLHPLALVQIEKGSQNHTWERESRERGTENEKSSTSSSGPGKRDYLAPTTTLEIAPSSKASVSPSVKEMNNLIKTATSTHFEKREKEKKETEDTVKESLSIQSKATTIASRARETIRISVSNSDSDSDTDNALSTSNVVPERRRHDLSLIFSHS